MTIGLLVLLSVGLNNWHHNRLSTVDRLHLETIAIWILDIRVLCLLVVATTFAIPLTQIEEEPDEKGGEPSVHQTPQ